jgi:hypothetical protein
MVPFTVESFLEAFARHNAAIWPAQAAAYLLGGATLALAARGGRRASRAAGLLLAGAWAFVAIAYHLVQLTRVTPAAWIFGAAFLAEALLLARAAARGQLALALAPGPRTWIALALALYALAVYPLVGAALGHRWPRVPAFGVTPCPTVIFTYAVLLLARAPVPRRLLPIPLLWSAVGVSAAVSLGMREDLGLAVAGLVGTALLLAPPAPSPRARAA